MIRGLLTKELQQHGLLLGFLFMILLGGLALIAGNTMLVRMGGSAFSGVKLLLITFVPLACLVLNHALIATEFRQKTQLFLEGLPLPRWRMLIVKFVLGLVVLMTAVLASLAVAWIANRGIEAMTPRFAVVLALKTAGWTWFIYTLFFSHAFLGRYRLPFAVVLLIALMALHGAGVELDRFGPFLLLDDRFAYERVLIPRAALWITFGSGLALTALGFSLGLVRDATVASLLAEHMSSREKVFSTFLVVATILVAAYLDEHYKSSTPVQMPGAIEVSHGAAKVFASAAVDAPSREELATLQTLAQKVAQELGEVAEFLHCETLPPVFIVHRRDLDATDFQKGDITAEQGLMVRVNATEKEFKESELQKWLVREILSVRSHGLLERERNAWVLDGFVEWWPHRHRSRRPSFDWLRTEARARGAMPADFSTDKLRDWFTLRAAAGPRDSHALAATGLQLLAQTHGEEAQQRFLSASLGRPVHADARGWFRDVIKPIGARFRDTIGIPLDTFVKTWRETLTESSKPAPLANP